MSSSVDAAKHPSVPSQEQNGLVARECLVTERVVRTGLEFSVPKLNFNSLNKKIVYMIGNPNITVNLVMNFEKIKVYTQREIADRNSRLEKLETIKKDIDEFKGENILWCFLDSILDLPSEYRSKAVVICFDESSYSGRQCLFHQFGSGINALSQEKSSKIGSKPYQAFVELMEKVQESGDAIVFVPKALQSETLKEVMWCPAKVEAPPAIVSVSWNDLRRVYHNRDLSIMMPNGNYTYPVEVLPNVLREWVLRECPTLKFVNFGSSYGIPDGMAFKIWGWTSGVDAFSPNRDDRTNWQNSFYVTGMYPKVPSAPVPTPASPDVPVPTPAPVEFPVVQETTTATQLAALTEAITNLTRLIQAKMT